MEFSASYRSTMNNFVMGGSLQSLTNHVYDARTIDAYRGIVKATITPHECIIPSQLIYIDETSNLENLTEPEDIVAPLYREPFVKVCSGADALFKYICRWCDARLGSFKVKDDTYYGNRGILLDKNYTPLLLSTAHLKEENSIISVQEYVIHVHPSVFTEETTVNKAIARKGIPYYLSYVISNWGNSAIPCRIVIDDSSDFYVKPSKPDFNNFSSDQVNNFLKEHIGEVLRQVADDFN